MSNQPAAPRVPKRVAAVILNGLELIEDYREDVEGFLNHE